MEIGLSQRVTLTEDTEDEVEIKFETVEEQEQPWIEFEGPDFYTDLVGDSLIGEDAKLTAAKRKALSASSFADPENRAYPVMDASHARAALQRFMQFGRRKYKGSKKASVARRILSAAKRFKVMVSDMVRKRMMGDSVSEVNDLQKTYSNLSFRGLLWARNRMRVEGSEDSVEFEVSTAELERRRKTAS